MRQLVYDGAHGDRLEVPIDGEDFEGGYVTFVAGEPLDVDDVLANGREQHGVPGDDDYQSARYGLLARPDFSLLKGEPDGH